MMEKKAREAKKEYVKPSVSRVKLVIDEPILGMCWSLATGTSSSETCQQTSLCPLTS